MVKAAVATQSVDFQAIDRLEEKLRLLLSALDRARAEHGRAVEENGRLRAELDVARARINEAEGAGTELTLLRGEREQIRERVNDMLKQIEALNL
jgi:regulator of replication initiation timing